MKVLKKFLDFPEIIGRISDIRLQAGKCPWVNINRAWRPHPYLREPVMVDEVKQFILEGLAINDEADLQIAGRELDFAFSCSLSSGRYRFRAHESQNYQGVAIDLRILREHVDSLEDLGFQHGLADSILSHKSGLIIVGGPTGSGKSTTLAALVQTFARLSPGTHLVTLEDPVEYLIEGTECLVSQKQVPVHVRNWEDGIFLAKREKPDLLVIGEMRSKDAIRSVIEAAGSGHLVMATTFADRISRVLDTLCDAYPVDEHLSLHNKLSYLLRGIICQTLVPGVSISESSGMPQLVYEALINDQQGIRSAIQKGCWTSLDLKSFEAKGSMMTWNSRLSFLLAHQQITPEIAEMVRRKQYHEQ